MYERMLIIAIHRWNGIKATISIHFISVTLLADWQVTTSIDGEKAPLYVVGGNITGTAIQETYGETIKV